MNPSSHDQTVVAITTGTILRGILLGIGLYGLYLLSDVVLALLAAVVMASAIEPIASAMTMRWLPRVFAVLLIYVLFFSLVAGVVYFFVPQLLDELTSAASQLPQYIASLDILGSDSLKQFLIALLPVKDILPTVRGAIGSVSGGVFQTASSFFGSAVNFVLIIVLSFYLSVQKGGVEDFLRLITHEKYEAYVLDLWARSRRKIGLWMQGQLLLGAIIGIFAFLALSILGVKYALLLAVLAAVFELIPVFGPIMAAVPAVAVGFSSSPFLGLMVLAFYVIIQQFENHLIYPLVVRKVVGVPPLIVIIALVVGGKLVGVLGIILAVPVASALMELVSDIEKKKYPKNL